MESHSGCCSRWFSFTHWSCRTKPNIISIRSVAQSVATRRSSVCFLQLCPFIIYLFIYLLQHLQSLSLIFFLSSPKNCIHKKSGSVKVSPLVTYAWIIMWFHTTVNLLMSVTLGWCFVCMLCICDVQVGKRDLWTENTVHWIYQNVQN